MDAPQGTPTWVTSFGWAGGLGSRTAPNACELPTLLALCDPPALGVVPLAEEAEERNVRAEEGARR